MGGGSGILLETAIKMLLEKFPEILSNFSIDWTIVESPGFNYAPIFSKKTLGRKIKPFRYVQSDYKAVNF